MDIKGRREKELWLQVLHNCAPTLMAMYCPARDLGSGFFAQLSRSTLRTVIQKVKKINRSRLGRDARTPEPEVHDPTLGVAEDPERGAQVLGLIAERPAAHHPECPRTRTQGIDKNP